MPWIDDNFGHTLSGLTQIGNIEGEQKKVDKRF